MAVQAARIRPPAVAGHFYQKDPVQLRSEVQDLLARSSPSPTITPKALIAPHAGYVYSGKIAATAFAMLRHCAQTTTRVVLIGPAHYVRVRGIAAPTVQAFATPLGRVPVDAKGLLGIADLPFLTYADEPHAPEHALEVELPFLQTALSEFEVLPLVVGDASPSDGSSTSRACSGAGATDDAVRRTLRAKPERY
jgi:MEMO1 family protein